MKSRAWKALLAAIVLFVATGLIVPFVRADRFREPVQHALVVALSREVKLGAMHWTLFAGPGIRVDDVTIQEDPALGAEPLAYVGSLVVTPSISSIWHGRLECSSLLLEDTHVNLARSGAGAQSQWNVSRLVRPGLLSAFPEIRMRGGRINFRIGREKSIFYFFDTDLDVTPRRADGSDWAIRLRGEPARSDRPARGFGSFVADGRWRTPSASPARLTMNLKLDQSELGDVLALILGRDPGLQGHISGGLKLEGPLDALKLEGRARMEDLHGWEQVPPSGEAWTFDLSGRLDAPKQELEMRAKAVGRAPALETTLRVSHYLGEAAWGVQTTVNHLPLDPLADVGRHLGLTLPERLRVTGTVDGAIGYSQSLGWAGKLAVSKAAVTLPDAAPVRVEQADVLVDAGHARLLPVRAETTEQDAATVESDLELATGAFQVSLQSNGMALQSLQRQTALVGIPLLSHCRAGTWSGGLLYRRSAEGAGEWSGQIRLADAEIQLDGAAQTVTLAAAAAELKGELLTVKNIHGAASGMSVEGDYEYDPRATSPHRFHLQMPRANAESVEQLWLPVLRRRNNLLDLALGRAPLPDWMKTWKAEGSLQIASLELAGYELKRWRAHVAWDGALVNLLDVRAQLGGGELQGRAAVDLSRGAPVYDARFQVIRMAWNSGRLDAENHLHSSGTGRDLLANLKANGTFEGSRLDLGLDNFDRVNGTYEAQGTKLRLPQVKLTSDDETLSGTGELQRDGGLLLRFTSPRPLNVEARVSGEWKALP